MSLGGSVPDFITKMVDKYGAIFRRERKAAEEGCLWLIWDTEAEEGQPAPECLTIGGVEIGPQRAIRGLQMDIHEEGRK